MVEFHQPQESPLGVAEQQHLQTISMFASAVGLSPSALRQYGESGLIAPAAVEARTGYRTTDLISSSVRFGFVG
jgi:DNA polymerase-3 subunit beta